MAATKDKDELRRMNISNPSSNCDRNVKGFIFTSLALVLVFVPIIIVGFMKLSSSIDKENEEVDLSCNPRVYVQELYVPAFLSIHNHTRLNSSVIIGLEFKRGAALPEDLNMYTDLNMKLYYGDGPNFPVANGTVPAFRMGDRKRVPYTAVVEALSLPWEEAFDKLSRGSSVLLRVQLSGKFRAKDRPVHGNYCNYEWSELQVEAQVWVDASAHMLSNTSIVLT